MDEQAVRLARHRLRTLCTLVSQTHSRPCLRSTIEDDSERRIHTPRCWDPLTFAQAEKSLCAVAPKAFIEIQIHPGVSRRYRFALGRKNDGQALESLFAALSSQGARIREHRDRIRKK